MESICCGGTPKSGILWAQKWDFKMSSALDRARNIGMAGLFTVLSIGIAANNNQAYAKVPAKPDMELFADDGGKDDPAPKTNANASGLEFKNASKASLVNAMASAGSISRDKDGLVILYCGNNRETGERIKRVLERLHSQGYKVIGAVKTLSDPQAANSQECFATMIKGTQFGEFHTDLSERNIEIQIVGCLRTMGYEIAGNTNVQTHDLVAK